MVWWLRSSHHGATLFGRVWGAMASRYVSSHRETQCSSLPIKEYISRIVTAAGWRHRESLALNAIIETSREVSSEHKAARTSYARASTSHHLPCKQVQHYRQIHGQKEISAPFPINGNALIGALAHRIYRRAFVLFMNVVGNQAKGPLGARFKEHAHHAPKRAIDVFIYHVAH